MCNIFFFAHCNNLAMASEKKEKAHFKLVFVREGHDPERFRDLTALFPKGIYKSANGTKPAAR